MAKILLVILVSLMPDVRIKLQPKQYQAMEIIRSGQYSNILYGGAKFGGKSFLARAAQFERRIEFAGTVGVIIRRTFPELLANHIRKFLQEYPMAKDWYKSSEKAIYYPNGSITEFKHLQNTNDVYDYQGLEYDDITLDEATQHDAEVIKILRTSKRADPKIQALHPHFRPLFLMTGNPGGVGHAEVKRLFIDKSYLPNEQPDDYCFIPAKIYDNPMGMEANPDYLNTLLALPEDLRRAYLDGDWDVFIGQFFKDFRRDIHGIEPIGIPEEWGKIFGLDWGYSPHPYHVGWYARDFSGNIFKYREAEGLETPPNEVAELIGKTSKLDQGLKYGVGDTQMWELNPFSKSKGEMVSDKSIAMMINTVLAKHNLVMLKANKARKPGWTQLRSLMKWDAKYDENGERQFTRMPKYFIFNTCPITLSAYPQQIHSQLIPEDMMKQDGDDPCDTDRYAIMYIGEAQYIDRQPPEKEKKIDSHLKAFEEADEEEHGWHKGITGILEKI